MAKATVNKINKVIEARYGVCLIKGNGYFWFAQLKDDTAYIPSVYSCHLDCMTLEGWIDYVKDHADSQGYGFTDLD